LRPLPDPVRRRPGGLPDDGAHVAEGRSHLVVLSSHDLLLDMGYLPRALQERLRHHDGHLRLLAGELRQHVLGQADRNGVEEVLDRRLDVHQAPSGLGMEYPSRFANSSVDAIAGWLMYIAMISSCSPSTRRFTDERTGT